ncbi:MAG: hypothetical protein JNL01_03175 [Bdellovibrionales bacterium]|nr:hypothetical protein [Bdellovibrionales bacterium]
MKNKMRIKISAFLVSMFFSACASSGVTVLERSDDVSSRPEWASVTKATFKKDGTNFYVGYVALEGQSSPSAAMNMSDEKALSEPMKSLVSQFMDQNQVGEDLRNTTGSRIISSLRSERLPMPSLQVTKRYWERVKLTDGEGITRIELRVYSLAEVSDADFQRARQIAFDKLQGKPEIRKVLDEVGKQQRDRAISGEQN